MCEREWCGQGVVSKVCEREWCGQDVIGVGRVFGARCVNVNGVGRVL